MLYDNQAAWVRKRLYLPVAQAGNGSLSGLTMTQLIGSLYGLKITSVGTPTEFTFPLPKDVNPTWPLGFRIHFAGSGTTVGTVSWIILQHIKLLNAALVAAATGALDTVITLPQTQVTTYANKSQVSSRGIRNANFCSRSDVFNGAWMQASVELDAAGGTVDASNAVWLLGLEMDYVPMLTRFPHSEFDCPLDDAVG